MDELPASTEEQPEICFSPTRELAEAAAFEQRLMTITRVVLLCGAGFSVIALPFVVYVGEIWCKLNGLEAPNTYTIVAASVASVATIIAYGFKKDGRRD